MPNQTFTMQKDYTEISIIDQETVNMLKEYAAGSPELVKDIIDSFRPEAEELVEKIKNILNSSGTKDFEELRKSVHSLAGISGSIGANRLWQIASDTESAIKEPDFDSAIIRAELIPGVFEELVSELERF